MNRVSERESPGIAAVFRCARAVLLAGLTVSLAGPALAADPRFPDWPCVQLKVPELSIAAVWSGAPIDAVLGNWQEDPRIAELVPRLAARRTPLEEAEKQIANFLENAGDRERKGTLLFAGLFEVLSRQRAEVMDGIERFSRKQKAVTEKIRSKEAELHRMQDADADQSKIDDLANQLEWDIRVYEDEKKTLSYVCEVPQLIERRLFGLSRAIQRAID
jgi:hypothetical protein